MKKVLEALAQMQVKMPIETVLLVLLIVVIILLLINLVLLLKNKSSKSINENDIYFDYILRFFPLLKSERFLSL